MESNINTTYRYRFDPVKGYVYDYTAKPSSSKSRKRAKSTPTFSQVVAKIKADKDLNVGIEAMKERMDAPTAALVGIGIHDPARQVLEDGLDRIWAASKAPKTAGEVIIGAGFHAAVYCAIRAAAGHPKPLVVEGTDRVGGAFAITRSPSFYLNSRNRPGNLGTPGRSEALNVLPGGPIQPSMLSTSEFQRNSDLAYAIRLALAKHAKVVTEFQVARRIDEPEKAMRLLSADGRAITAKRIILATGAGVPARPRRNDGAILLHKRILNYYEFMQRMDMPFPLQGLGRVAVVGGGDSGKTVIEALVGQSPQAGMSVASLDYIDRIDWYGVSSDRSGKASWIECNRSRYKGIASALGNRSEARVRILADENAEEVVGTYDAAMVNGRMYDHVIWCTGFERTRSNFDPARFDRKSVDGRDVGLVGRDPGNEEVFIIGPAAELPMEGYEASAAPRQIPENSVALYRYADRTAALANSLAAV